MKLFGRNKQNRDASAGTFPSGYDKEMAAKVTVDGSKVVMTKITKQRKQQQKNGRTSPSPSPLHRHKRNQSRQNLLDARSVYTDGNTTNDTLDVQKRFSTFPTAAAEEGLGEGLSSSDAPLISSSTAAAVPGQSSSQSSYLSTKENDEPSGDYQYPPPRYTPGAEEADAENDRQQRREGPVDLDEFSGGDDDEEEGFNSNDRQYPPVYSDMAVVNRGDASPMHGSPEHPTPPHPPLQQDAGFHPSPNRIEKNNNSSNNTNNKGAVTPTSKVDNIKRLKMLGKIHYTQARLRQNLDGNGENVKGGGGYSSLPPEEDHHHEAHPPSSVTKGGYSSATVNTSATSMESISTASTREAEEEEGSDGVGISAAGLEAIQQDQLRKAAHLSNARSALSRPFGREYLPAEAKRWQAQVDPPNWDAHANEWNYTISIQLRPTRSGPHFGSYIAPADDGGPVDGENNNYATTRTLQDVHWLEASLIHEFAGSLLLPVLSTYYAPASKSIRATGEGDAEMMPSALTNQDKVDALAIQHWFNDTFNGIRGEGEVMLGSGKVGGEEIAKSESVETFFFLFGPLPTGVAGSSPTQRSLPRDNQWEDGNDNGAPTESILRTILANPMFACFDPTMERNQSGCPNPRRQPTLPLEMLSTCSSRATQLTDDEVGNENNSSLATRTSTPRQDSSLDTKFTTETPNSSQLAIHSELIEAYKMYSRNFQKRVLPKCHKKLAILLHYETLEGAAWKRLAISLSNLFAFEKEIYESKLSSLASEKKDGRHPAKRLKKSDIEDGLRLIARQKTERGTLALRGLQAMMTAFQSDVVGAIPRSLDAYMAATEHLSASTSWIQSFFMGDGTNNASVSPSSRDSADSVKHYMSHQSAQLKTIASQRLDSVRKQLYNNPSMKPLFGNGPRSSNPKDDDNGHEYVPPGTTSSPFTNEQIESRHNILCQKVIENEARLRTSLRHICSATPIRMARMSWSFFKMEAGQASLLSSASMSIKTKVVTPHGEQYVREMRDRHTIADEDDDDIEFDLLQRILDLSNSDMHQQPNRSLNDHYKLEEEQRIRSEKCSHVLQMARECVGRWDAKFALAVMEAAGIEDAEVRVEETTRDLRLVRQYAIGLRECVDRCVEAVDSLMGVIHGDGDAEYSLISGLEGTSPFSTSKRQGSVASGESQFSMSNQMRVDHARRDFMLAASVLFSGVMVDDFLRNKNPKLRQSHRSSPSKATLANAGIETNDPAGWLSAIPSHISMADRGCCGKAATAYCNVRQMDVSSFLSNVAKVLTDYEARVEGIESYVYMHCVGIQLEKHFSKCRAEALAAWEKKTDITTAINIATRKRLPLLVKELEAKLEQLSSSVSHTGVKQAKERHLASKGIKTELHNLANRRFHRARESATEKVITLIRMWAEHEETVAAEELKALGEAIREIERTLTEEDIQADGGAHLFSSSVSLRTSR